MKVLVTGANGFVGRYLTQLLVSEGFEVTAVVRASAVAQVTSAHSIVIVDDICSVDEWTVAAKGQDAVVHLAARAHILHESGVDSMSEYTRINVEGTKSIIEGCLAAKVGRFLYLSSIKVNGEKTVDLPFRCDDVPRPIGGYAISKKLAEDALMKTCAAGRIDWVIIRPPLVYGSGVKANFSRLINFAQSGWFVPLGACQNHRSIVYVGNLCSLISRSLVDKRACGQTLLVSDGRDLTVAELIREISKASCKPTRLVYVPRFLLSVAGTILGMKNQIDRLTQPLEVDISETTALLNWHPPFDVEEAIRLTVHG